MFAVIRSGSKQYKVQEGDTLDIELVEFPKEGEKKITLELIEGLLGLPKSQLMFDLAEAIARTDIPVRVLIPGGQRRQLHDRVRQPGADLFRDDQYLCTQGLHAE